jgi:hypothetical protein
MEGYTPARQRHYRRSREDSPLLTTEPKRTYRRNIIKLEEEIFPPKPPAIGSPIVWADTRQELCEGLPYFRSYQGGIYFRDDVVFGYLLDAFGAERDYIGSHVVISHGYHPLLPCANSAAAVQQWTQSLILVH